MQEGVPIFQIAHQIGRSLTTIYKIRKELNLPRAQKNLYAKTKTLDQFEPYIKRRVRQGVTNIRKLHIELQEKGYKESYTTVYRYVKLVLNPKLVRKYKSSQRIETNPGEQAQVDWGSFGKITINGREEKLSCFVYVLSYSRAIYIEFTIKQNLETLQLCHIHVCHIHAFKRLGISKIIRYDNMKTVVLRREKLPDRQYIPHFHPDFLEFLSIIILKLTYAHLAILKQKEKLNLE